MDLARVCEYSYRKGVSDAASCGDFLYVLEVANREDNYTTFRFLNDEYGVYLPLEQYHDYVCIFSSYVKAEHLRAFMRFGKNVKELKKSICILVDYCYRKGMVDGTELTKEKGKNYLHELKKKMNHNRPNGIRQRKLDWIEELKYATNTIYNLHRFKNIKTGMNQLSILIAKAVIDSKHAKNYETNV